MDRSMPRSRRRLHRVPAPSATAHSGHPDKQPYLIRDGDQSPFVLPATGAQEESRGDEARQILTIVTTTPNELSENDP
jgi:putative SOS response-associated peptidase YedK